MEVGWAVSRASEDASHPGPGKVRRRGQTGEGCTIGRARLYVTYGATCAINSDVVVAARGRARATAACARTASQRPTYDYVSRTVYVTRSNSRMGVARKRGYAGAGAGLNLLDDMICYFVKLIKQRFGHETFSSEMA